MCIWSNLWTLKLKCPSNSCLLYHTAKVEEQSSVSDTQKTVAICSPVPNLSHPVLSACPRKLPVCPFSTCKLCIAILPRGKSWTLRSGLVSLRQPPLLPSAHHYSSTNTKSLINHPDRHSGMFQSIAMHCCDYLRYENLPFSPFLSFPLTLVKVSLKAMHKLLQRTFSDSGTVSHLDFPKTVGL